VAFVAESDGCSLTSASGTGTFQFKLEGGQYSFDVNSSASGTVLLSKVMGDGTLVTEIASVTGTAAGVHNTVSTGPGLYQIVVGTAGCDVGISKVLKTG
jgi:hypothetical protein